MELEDSLVLVQISVKDYGIGIKEEDMRNLFKPYFKTTDESSLYLNKSSNGLGLYISKKIARSFKGNISVNSTKGFGATFIL